MNPEELARSVFREAASAHEAFARTGIASIVAAAAAISDAIRADGKVLAFGNGGSAADAQHFVAELVGRFERERSALPAIALTADTSVLTGMRTMSGSPRKWLRSANARLDASAIK